MFIGVKTQHSKSCPSFMRHPDLTLYIYIQKIIKLFQTVWELWPGHDFGIRGYKYIREKKVRVLLGHDMPTGPNLCLY